MVDEAIDPEEDQREFEAHRLRFYALIGHCVTSYQTVEDYLPKVFSAALGGSEAKASAIFQLARGLEAKLDAVMAALVESPESQQSRWTRLLRRVAKAAEARNQIAHASPVHHGGGLTIIMSENPEKKSQVIQTGRSRMELRKRTKAGEKVWTEELMRNEVERNIELFRHLIGFVKELRGEAVPEHLREA